MIDDRLLLLVGNKKVFVHTYSSLYRLDGCFQVQMQYLHITEKNIFDRFLMLACNILLLE
jgi:hypothetical protein